MISSDPIVFSPSAIFSFNAISINAQFYNFYIFAIATKKKGEKKIIAHLGVMKKKFIALENQTLENYNHTWCKA